MSHSYRPTAEFKYFFYDENGSGFTYYKTTQERDEAANDAIQLYLDDGWSEEVESVVVGEVTGQATQVDIVQRPNDSELDEDSCDEEGQYWDSDHEFMCNYKIMGLGK